MGEEGEEHTDKQTEHPSHGQVHLPLGAIEATASLLRKCKDILPAIKGSMSVIDETWKLDFPCPLCYPSGQITAVGNRPWT